MLEALVAVWTEELVNGGRIELENFMVFETQTLDRGERPGALTNGKSTITAPCIIRRLVIRTSKRLRRLLNQQIEGEY